MLPFPKLTYAFNANPNQNPEGILVEINKLMLDFIDKCKGPGKSKAVFKNYDKVGGLTLLISGLLQTNCGVRM